MRIRLRRSSASIPRPAIPTAAIANLVFLTIVFYVWTFHTDVDKATVSLPRTELRVEVPARTAIVSITENGQLRVSDGESASIPVSGPEDLLTFASGIVANEPDKAFALKADAAVPYRTVDRVFDVLRQARVRAVYLLSEAELASDGARAR